MDHVTAIHIALDGTCSLKPISYTTMDGECDVDPSNFTGTTETSTIKKHTFYNHEPTKYIAYYVSPNESTQAPKHPFRNALLPNNFKCDDALRYRNEILVVRRFEPEEVVSTDAPDLESHFKLVLKYRQEQWKTQDCGNEDILWLHHYIANFEMRYGLEP